MVRGCAAVLAAAAVVCAPLAAAPQEGKSSALAHQLAQLLDAKKLDSIAAPDPQNLGTYVAALYYPGAQLLVVSAKYPAPPLLNEKIGNKQYRDVYIDLNSASVPDSKMFVMDMNCDGLVAKPPENSGADSYSMGQKAATFDGEWKKAKMSEADYTKAYDDADTAYAHALQLLINQLNSGT
jgi:hypothetical protein